MTSWLEVDSFDFIHNIRVIRRMIGEAPILAVVKANAYGHDLAIATEALWRGGIDGWVVTEVSDAKWLAEQRYRLPILMLLPVADEVLPMALQQGWHLAVSSLEYLRRIEHAAGMRQKVAHVHLEIETGMHRTGLPIIEVEAILAKAQQSSSRYKIEGMFTHLFHTSNRDITHKQMGIVRELQFMLQRKGIPVPFTHVHASDGLANYADHYLFDGVRIGKALYGFGDIPETKPPLTWKTRIIATGELKPDETVGYSSTYQAQKKVKIATLPVGYSDGFDRRLGNAGSVLVAGKLCPVIGAVSMNHTTIDVSGVMKVEVGDEVVLLGKQLGGEIRLQDISKWTGILDYEFVSRLSRSIPRIKSK